MQEKITNIISTVHYWKDFINEQQVKSSDYIIILSNKNREIMYETLHLLAVFRYEKNVRRIILVAESELIKNEVMQYATCKCEFYVCNPAYITGLYGVLSRDSIFSNIILNEFYHTESVNAFDLVGINGITKREIVARGILRLNYVPTEEQIEVAQKYAEKHYKAIDWNRVQKWIPINHENLSMETFVKLKLIEYIRENQITEKNHIYILGKTVTAKVIHTILDEEGYSAAGFLDNRAKDKEYFETLPVYVPESKLIPFDDDCRILVSVLRYKDICEQLYALGYELGKHVFLLNSRYNTTDGNAVVNIDVTNIQTKIEHGRALFQEIRNMYPDTCFMICPYQGTGDIYLLNLYLPEYRENKNMNDVKFIVPSSTLKRISGLFKVDSLVYSMKEIEELLYFVQAVGEHTANMQILDINIYQFKNSMLHTTLGLDYNTMLHRLLFKTGSRYIRPLWIQEHAESLLDMIQGDKTIILSPYANTIKEISKEFWISLADILTKRGYKVFTNVASEREIPVEGTEPVFIPFSEILSAMGHVKCFIGLRSGLCDMISSTTNKMVVLYTQNETLNLYSLDKMGLKSRNLLEIVYKEVDKLKVNDTEIIKKILSFIEDKENEYTTSNINNYTHL